MTKPRLVKVRALFSVFQHIAKKRLRHIKLHSKRFVSNFWGAVQILTQPLFLGDNKIQGLFHCEFCYLVANFDNVETWGYGD